MVWWACDFLLAKGLVYPFELVATINGESAEPPTLLDRLRFARQANHYAHRTEHAYLNWARHLIRHDGISHPQEMDGPETTDGSSHTAVALPSAHNKATTKPLPAHDEPLYGLECQESVRILFRLFLALLILSFLGANDRIVKRQNGC